LLLGIGSSQVDTGLARYGTPVLPKCDDDPVTTDALTHARAGSEDAFRQLTEPHLRELHVHCYRMLGSLDDADDLLQETLIAAWRGLGDFRGSASLRTWLYRIATNRCLNAIRGASRRPPAAPVPPFDAPEPTGRYEVGWLQPYPDEMLDPSVREEMRSGIELAFVAMLQLLPPRQTAAVVLADVLGFDLAETAEILQIGPMAVKGLLQRGRAGLAAARDAGKINSGQPADHDQESRLASRFAAAFSSDDVGGVIALLTDDAWLAMPPAPQEYVGTQAIGGFLRASAAGRGGPLQLLPTRANGQPAFGCYLADSGSARPVATGILVITVPAGVERISCLTRFLDDRLHRRFGLPDVL
jgi:RNA polymerase sigma-70 factor (TIGR02960 family)